MAVEIAVSVLPASELVDADAIEIRDVWSQEELDEAVSGGHKVYRDEGDGPPEEIYDGSEWLTDERPVPTPVPSVSVPETPYVDQRIDLLQAEVEALTEALLQVDPDNATALAVRSLAPDARTAIAFDEEAGMDEAIGALRGAKVSEKA